MKLTKEQQTQQAYDLFNEFREAYMGEWERLDKCERIYHGEHWYGIPERDKNEPRPVTPVIQSTIESVRADLMDQSPDAIIIADDPKYDSIAELLTAVVRENHTRLNYNAEYANLAHDLLVGGYMVQETGYDATLNNGLGGAFIRHVDTRNIMLDPCATQIGDCRAVFKFTPYPREWFLQHYPTQAQEMEADTFTVRRLRDEVLLAQDHDSILLIECWRRIYDKARERYTVHMEKYAGHRLLEDSRNVKSEGYFCHGEYPFIITALFPRKGSCLGYGFVDMFETQQRFSDKLDQIVLKNALMASHNKLLITGASGFDVDDLRDWSKEVHKGENLNGVTWFPTAPLPAYMIQYIRSIREGIKEESGANDFSRGTTMGGVTAAAAIAALQEMSSKRSRMAARAMHGAFEAAVRQEIEIEREFTVFPRGVRTADQSRQFSSDMLTVKTRLGNELPLEFSISVKAQRENRFSVAAHNEAIIKLVQTGMVTPDVGLELMLFDGKAQAVTLMRKKRDEQLAQQEHSTPIAQREGARHGISAGK
ncbi:MAG: hypothetical protein RR232_06130 [Clostridia bacterium]